MSGWPVEIEDAEGDTIVVEVFGDGIFINITQGEREAERDAAVILTPAQSATLRAALEAAEKEMP